jgi:hypothetical protein
LTGAANVAWTSGADVGSLKRVTASGLAERFTDWTAGMTATGGAAGLGRLIFVVRYYLV